MLTAIRKSKANPRTLSDFRKIGKRRMGVSPESALAKQDQRKANVNLVPKQSLVQFILGNRHADIRPLNVAGIPLGDHDGNGIARINDRRKKNWVGDKFTCGRSFLKTIDAGHYKGTWSGKTAYQYSRVVESWGAVISPQYLYWRIETGDGIQSEIAKAPHGWHWGLDANGIRLVNAKGLDYHPDATDLLELSPAEIAGKARENDRIRKANERKAKAEQREAERTAKQESELIERAEAEGCMVCLADSVRAGNCQAGSYSWGVRHGLESGKHYRPTELLHSAIDEQRRVTIAVASAMRRHRAEMLVGYCIVAEHKA